MTTIYPILQHAHSGLRWLLLLFLVLSVVYAYSNWMEKKPFWESHKKVALLGLIFTHLQILIGFILYAISPKVIFAASSMKESVTRFFLVEHLTGMVIGAILITIGYAKAKRGSAETSAKNVFIYYGIGLLLILATIPWPFRGLGTAWF